MFPLSSSHPPVGLFCGVTAFLVANVDLKNVSYSATKKRGHSGTAKNDNVAHARRSKTTGKSGERRTGIVFSREEGTSGGAMVSRESIGGNWEPEVQWLFIGWVMVASHWLCRCQGRRKPFLLLLDEWQVGENPAQSRRTPVWAGVLLVIFTAGLKVIT